jgi:hypothetical protein
MSVSIDSDHFKLSVDTSSAKLLSKEELSEMKNGKATSSGTKDSFAGFQMNSARGKQDVEPISSFGGGFSIKKAS